MRSRFWRRLTAIALMSSACALVRFSPSEKPSYFPLEANRRWEYRLVVVDHDEAWPIAVRSRGPRFVPDLGRVVFLFDEEYPDQVLPVAFYFSEGFLQSEIGLRYDALDADDSSGVPGSPLMLPIGTQPMRIMPMPPKVGASWAYSEDVFGRSSQVDPGFVIHWRGGVGGEDRIEVPAGAFAHCIRVESVARHETPAGAGPAEYRYTDWYAPDVGLVKSEYAVGATPRTITRMELVGFAPADDAPIDADLQMARAWP
jgi:hypothetical protein